MDVTTIRSLHEYDAWATERILSCCEQLSVEDLTGAAAVPWGSIRNQFVHTFIVHRRWLSWADGALSAEDAYALTADPMDYPHLDALREMWSDVQQQNRVFLNRITSELLLKPLQVERPGFAFSIPTWHVMMHIAHHGMQHRTESAVALTELGASPGDIDYLFFAMEQT